MLGVALQDGGPSFQHTDSILEHPTKQISMVSNLCVEQLGILMGIQVGNIMSHRASYVIIVGLTKFQYKNLEYKKNWVGHKQ